ncbi:3-isopropylmalate dehydratase large subunit [bacterium]|nr:3-isopropylmalate dehydratase large subunit [bacterium]MBU1065554.1 3-isopropylmalate dehydratase large subunit [bacterium]MBU1633774.1 3-isopropylmalate dehydratase large subunit [bacterium]MBU1873525.1 3-isopropylmalate dehydratase large subunit [bacterium]
MGKTFSEKILGQKVGKDVVPGEIIEVEPDVAMSHDNTAAISKTFYKIGVDQVYKPGMHVVILDHCTPAANEKFAENHKDIREFVRKQGIRNFYDIHVGICHQVMHEKGHVWPGALIVGSDSHSTSYGAFGAFSAGIGRSEMAAIMARGKIWLRVPETIKIVVDGEFPEAVSAKDLMLKIAREIGADGALYKAIEFCGPTIDRMSVASRFVFTNMAVEIGAKAGYMIPNQATLGYLKDRVSQPFEVIESDPNAEYEAEYHFDVSTLEPMIAKPHTVDNVVPVSEVKGTRIDQIFFGSCTNARVEDFEIVAEILRGKRVHPDVRMLVFPASQEVYLEVLKKGWIQELVEAGCVIMNPGCGPCMGNHEGVPANGEVVLATSNRNFKGRLGNKESFVYLVSPRTAAMSALTGKIEDCWY